MDSGPSSPGQVGQQRPVETICRDIGSHVHFHRGGWVYDKGLGHLCQRHNKRGPEGLHGDLRILEQARRSIDDQSETSQPSLTDRLPRLQVLKEKTRHSGLTK